MKVFQCVVFPFVAACLLLFSMHVSAAPQNQQPNNPNAENRPAVVNINEATPAELQTLKGIGKSKAQAIISYRENQGKFNAVEDLSKVKGISNKTLALLLEKNPDRIVAE